MKHAIELTAAQSSQTLDNAVQTQAQVLVAPTGEQAEPVGGQIVCGDESVLLITLSRPLQMPAPLVGRHVDVEIYTDERYCFNSHVVNDAGMPGEHQIAIRRPAQIQILQRRRFLRVRVAPSANVHLRWAHQHMPRTADASLMNLSVEGLACRVTARDAATLTEGQAMTLTIDLPEGQGTFGFPAQLCNRTPSSNGDIILGLQFLVDEEDELAAARRAQLRDWLYQRSENRVATEVVA